MPKTIAGRLPFFHPVATERPLVEPTRWGCLKCQLYGRRSALCFRLASCKELPLVLPLGPILLASFAAMAVAFFLAVR